MCHATVEIVPASVLFADHDDHHVIQYRVDEHRNDGYQRTDYAKILLRHEEAERDDRKYRTNSVQKETRTRENQKKALKRRKDEKGDQESKGDGGDPSKLQNHYPSWRVEIVLSKTVYRVRNDEGH